MNNYGIGLAFGYLGYPNKKEAMGWFKEAARLCSKEAMSNYGVGLVQVFSTILSTKKQ
jgi:hypothetical protein